MTRGGSVGVPHVRTGRSRRSRGARGQALVEFALVSLIFFGLVFAIIEFGTLLFARMTVANAVREGARTVVPYASEEVGLAEGIVAGAQSATSGASLGFLDSTDVTVACLSPAGVTKACTDAVPEDSVQVTGTYVYRPFFPALAGRVQIPLSSTVLMVLE